MTENISNITAVILAGGLGTRLKSVISNCPKVLAPVHGRPFIYYILDFLNENKIQKVILCTGYLGNQIFDCLGSTYNNLKLFYSQEPSRMGTAGAIKLASPFFDKFPILVLNGDSYCTPNLDNFLKFHYSKNSKISIVITKTNDSSRFGQISINEEFQITSMIEKNKNKNSEFINAGIYLLNEEIVNTISNNQDSSLEYEVFPKMSNHGLFGFIYNGDFADIGTPESYKNFSF